MRAEMAEFGFVSTKSGPVYTQFGSPGGKIRSQARFESNVAICVSSHAFAIVQCRRPMRLQNHARVQRLCGNLGACAHSCARPTGGVSHTECARTCLMPAAGAEHICSLSRCAMRAHVGCPLVGSSGGSLQRTAIRRSSMAGERRVCVCACLVYESQARPSFRRRCALAQAARLHGEGRRRKDGDSRAPRSSFQTPPGARHLGQVIDGPQNRNPVAGHPIHLARPREVHQTQEAHHGGPRLALRRQRRPWRRRRREGEQRPPQSRAHRRRYPRQPRVEEQEARADVAGRRECREIVCAPRLEVGPALSSDQH